MVMFGLRLRGAGGVREGKKGGGGEKELPKGVVRFDIYFVADC